LMIYDSSGHVIGQAQSTRVGGDSITFTLEHATPNARYVVKVQSAEAGLFDFGSFALAVTFDGLLTASPGSLDAVLRGPYESLSVDTIQQIFTNPMGVLFNSAPNAHNQFTTAQTLVPSDGYGDDNHFTLVASLSGGSDANFYKLRDPEGEDDSVVMTATV